MEEKNSNKKYFQYNAKLMKWLFFAPIFLSALSYDVQFVGIEDGPALESLRDASTLVSLQSRPPASINGLRYRISSDLPDLVKVLHAYGYYDAVITPEMQGTEFIQVILHIDSGVQYMLSSFTALHSPVPFTPAVNVPAISTEIVNTELDLLAKLADSGYPLANVEKRSVTVDVKEKQVHATTLVQEGPYAKFGPLSINGLRKVKEDYLLSKVSWKEGAVYHSTNVEETQKKLLDTNLFSSVMITHDETVNEDGRLPMKMQLVEAKNRRFSIGLFYATVDGFGGNFSWAHRNLQGRGEQLTIDGEFSTRYLAGSVVYRKPEFFRPDQVYRALAEFERERIPPYIAINYRAANFLERKFGKKSTFTVGLEVEHMNVFHSANNGIYLFADLPLQFCYMNADDLLNPTKGFTIVYQLSPYQSLFSQNVHFFKQRFTTTFYLPMRRRFVWAARAQFGSILGEAQSNIPLPILFLGGSEDDLRGYRYMTVSPVNSQNQPLGGRSAIFCSLEARLRLSEFLGLVPFADVGTVSFNQLPDFTTKWFKSVGIGARIFTFFGPLRLDVGFPLDRRKNIDQAYRIYGSVGQAF
jgi:translocation and assembly module TamA